MLNELETIERGMRDIVATVQRHRDIKRPRPIPTLLVQLDNMGQIAAIRPIPRQVTLWTLRDGNRNSFPFVQPKNPLWDISQDLQNDERRASVIDKNYSDRRTALLDLALKSTLDIDAFKNWPGTGLLDRLRERRQQFLHLAGTEAAVLLDTIDRFLSACDSSKGERALEFLHQLIEAIMKELNRSPQNEWFEIATALLIGSFDNKGRKWLCSGGLFFEASGKDLSIFDSKLIASVSDALSGANRDGGDASSQALGTCALSGTCGPLLKGSFSQPNLNILGQTYLFAKNRDIPANDRYGRFSADAMSIGEATDKRLAAALVALTSADLKNITWRPIPGEAPKQSDLLLAFVESVPDARLAASLAEEDFSDEEHDDLSISYDTIAKYEKRTERVIQRVKAKIGSDMAKTPVQVTIFRKVDLANRKVVYADRHSVAGYHKAAKAWVAGERNVPAWLTLPVLMKNEKRLQPLPPLHVAPLGLIGFSKQIFLRNGKRPEGNKKEQVGMTAAEAMKFFLDSAVTGDLSAKRRGERILRLILNRRAMLVAETAHAVRRGFDSVKEFDCRETLKTITCIGVLLQKLNRYKEEYMNETAFKLGQLLAAADIVHAGYCADVRGGDVPPALLGNQMFVMAQTTPVKALAALSRRWKPYDGWAKKIARTPNRIDTMLASDKKQVQQRGWDIKKALRYAREMSPLAAALAPALGECRVDDLFRAELLLGYIAGLPKFWKDEEHATKEYVEQEG